VLHANLKNYINDLQEMKMHMYRSQDTCNEI